MIEFKNINKVFCKKRETVRVLKNVSFKIDQHDILGVIGYSGAGKGTLVRLVNQLGTASDDQVIVDGHEIDTYKEKGLRGIRKDIGMIFQHFNLLNSKSVCRNVAIPPIPSKTDKKEIEKKVDKMLEFMGLTGKKDQFPNELSGGQEQRIAIARVLVTYPRVSLYGEMTSALGPATISSTLNLLNNVNRTFGVAIMIITHEMSTIQRAHHRVAAVENGEAIEMGTVKDIFSHPQTNTAKNLVSTVINTGPSKELRASFDSRRNSNFIDYKLLLDSEQIQLPILNELINKHHLNVNVLPSSMLEVQDETACYLWSRFEHGESFNDFKPTDYLSGRHIRYKEVI